MQHKSVFANSSGYKTYLQRNYAQLAAKLPHNVCSEMVLSWLPPCRLSLSITQTHTHTQTGDTPYQSATGEQRCTHRATVIYQVDHCSKGSPLSWEGERLNAHLSCANGVTVSFSCQKSSRDKKTCTHVQPHKCNLRVSVKENLCTIARLS